MTEVAKSRLSRLPRQRAVALAVARYSGSIPFNEKPVVGNGLIELIRATIDTKRS